MSVDGTPAEKYEGKKQIPKARGQSVHNMLIGDHVSEGCVCSTFSWTEGIKPF